MRRVLTVLTLVSWALWFGGMVVLILFVTQIFRTLPRPQAVEAAPVLFRAFAGYQLIVGMVACASATLFTMFTRRNTHAVMTLMMLGALAAALLIRGWTNRMEAIRHAGQSSGPEFQALHHRSSGAYTTATGLLLVAGVGLIVTSSPPTSRRAGETAPA